MHDSDEAEIPDLNLFMMCDYLNRDALSELPASFHIRNCREDELDIWKSMPFDNPQEVIEYRDFMDDFFLRVYEQNRDLFFKKCLFVCNSDDRPVATAFIWEVHDALTTFHWLKVLKGYEDKGIGRALISIVMGALDTNRFPVYLHTQPGSYRAIKLYSDFGFKLLSNPIVGPRKNDLEECLPILEKYMSIEKFSDLKVVEAPLDFMRIMDTVTDDHF